MLQNGVTVDLSWAIFLACYAYLAPYSVTTCSVMIQRPIFLFFELLSFYLKQSIVHFNTFFFLLSPGAMQMSGGGQHAALW